MTEIDFETAFVRMMIIGVIIYAAIIGFAVWVIIKLLHHFGI